MAIALFFARISQTAAGGPLHRNLTSLHADGGASLRLTRAGRKYHYTICAVLASDRAGVRISLLRYSLRTGHRGAQEDTAPISGTQMNVSEAAY